ncbi:MAG: SGNH/GDSL hydrolase family protein, partial [Oscillospiraceae bacterium]
MQNLFKEYVSNTVAGTSNNYILKLDAPKKITGRIYVKVNEYGEFDYRFFFSNNVDSTFADGAVAHVGLKGGKWEIISAFAGVSNTADPNSKSITFLPVTFNSETKKEVYPGEMFWSDCVKLDIKPEQYLFFEWTVFGNNIPFTPDKIVESFVKTETGFTPCVDFAQPHLFGCNRLVKKRIAFFGDSITQGLGTRDGLYEFWVAKIAQTLGNDYSVWNLGLGYGRAQDAAQNLSWAYKAKQADLVSVCFGVNDILQGRTANQICADLKTIVTILKSAGCEVGIFTV